MAASALDNVRRLVEPLTEPSSWKKRNEEAFDALFGAPGGRYDRRAKEQIALRAPDIAGDGVAFVSYLHPANPDSGAYGGMSFALFPVPEAPALITMVVGTNGMSPDEEILARPGHARRVGAICRWLNAKHGHGNLVAWSKQDIVAIDQDIPRDIALQFPSYDAVFRRYGRVLYAVFAPPMTTDDSGARHPDEEAVRDAISAFLDLTFYERGIAPLTNAAANAEQIRSEWQRFLLPGLDIAEVERLLTQQRFVVIEGPPGTGKTKMALDLLQETYGGRGMSVQFHPNTTYEDVVGGLAPVQSDAGVGLQFQPTPGIVMRAAVAATQDATPYLLHIDEINRTDLSKVLGEAIYLLEAHPERARRIELAHDFGEPYGRTLTLPDNLHIVGTMNSADRSLAVVDVAVRRRFAFAQLWPQSSVVADHGCELMQAMFASLLEIFIDYATEDSFALVPGHSYFLEADDAAARRALKVTVAPLLREYLQQGYVAGFAEPIRAYLQRIDSL